ncbi:MAG TPA: bifunctional glutamate N-acetyltransferase/amino-acid acetyltransferase ArgJ [Thiolinea sp.]|nr:bifunctional glutamate N-acetyltransferase/amino-acid acetyltransferase ArgJ [Thiolinea sp.]
MAVNLEQPGVLLPVAGVRLSAVNAGIRYKGRNDMVLVELAEGSQCAGVFTRNRFCAAPVQVSREHLAQGKVRYWLINAGNANAGTGEPGMQAARQSCAGLAALAGCEAGAVLPFSTGVIGVQLPVEKLHTAFPPALAALDENHWLEAARGIMTTDTLPKAISRQVTLPGGTVTLTGIAKGSGMIHPDMATMLGFVATDAQVEAALLQQLLSEVADETFNAITVDGDTSTNDSLVLAATGASGVRVGAAERDAFREALRAVCSFLAQAIVRDGEGATKFISIHVHEARDKAEARKVGQTVALSPLVKTAMFASDPNWGRILAAIGRSPVDDLDVAHISIRLGDTLLIEAGEPAASYREEMGQQEMKKAEIDVHVRLGRGEASATVWTCDFSYEYVRINAEYRS